MSWRILWAEDQEDFLKGQLPLLMAQRATVVVESNAHDALSRLRTETFDLVLVDLQMPPGPWGGLVLISESGPLKNEIPFIVVSGAGTLTECIEAMRMGAADYVTKESCQTELLPVIKKALEKHSEGKPISDYAVVRRIEQDLHRIVLSLLRSELAKTGKDDIFRAFFNIDTSLKCYKRMLEADGSKQEEFLDLIDFREVIDKQWTRISDFRLLEKIVRPRTRDERTRWLVDLNNLRKVIAHPVRGSLDDVQRETLKHVNDIVQAWSDACE